MGEIFLILSNWALNVNMYVELEKEKLARKDGKQERNKFQIGNGSNENRSEKAVYKET